LLFSKEPISFRTFERSPQNIYITSEEEIKEGDYVINNLDKLIGKSIRKLNSGEIKDREYSKIILTTDQDLIKNGVQAIDDNFIEWLVKNPSCEKVEVEEFEDGDCEIGSREYINYSYEIIIPEEEPKQETLKEAAERLFKEFQIENPIVPNNHIGPFKLGFIKSAKWQAERMYSEEDMIEFAEFVATYPDKNKNINGQILHAKSKYDGSERTVDLLEQFKKK
jgi:hypothetical protein